MSGNLMVYGGGILVVLGMVLLVLQLWSMKKRKSRANAADFKQIAAVEKE